MIKDGREAVKGVKGVKGGAYRYQEIVNSWSPEFRGTRKCDFTGARHQSWKTEPDYGQKEACEETMNEKQFDIICKKLDTIAALQINQAGDRDKKIKALKKVGLSSVEISNLLGVEESAIRKSKGWKK